MINYFNSFNQKDLYFKIQNVISYQNGRVYGIYAIFKDDLCVYVGQSSNLASRIATHLSGKYKNATRIDLFLNGDSCSKERLLNSERYAINKLEPTDNIIVDYDSCINEDELIDDFYNCDKSDTCLYSEYSIHVSNKEYLIISKDMIPSIYGNDEFRKLLLYELNSAENAKKQHEH